jgi:uridine kinase
MKIIAIAGGSGSGKSYLVRLLQIALAEKVSVLSLDNYYKPKHTQVKDHNGIENFDLPTAFDHEKLAIDLLQLKSGKPITFKQYNYNNSQLVLPDLLVEPAPIVLFEGIFALSYPSLLPLFDYTIFVEADTSIALKRRLKRDHEERGYEANDVQYRFENHVLPAYYAQILPHKLTANSIIESNALIHKQVEALLTLAVFQ